MPFFSEYEKFLSMQWSIDYWSDQAIDEAVAILDKFDDEDWIALSDNWIYKDSTWQERCAETLSETEPKKSLSILLSMLNSENEELLDAVVDSLNSFAQINIQINLNTEQLEKMHTLSQRGGISAIVVSNFLKKINN